MKAKGLDVALTAAADALMIDLSMKREKMNEIWGNVFRHLGWFGSDLSINPIVVESIADKERDLIALLVHFVGNLYGVLISDAKNGELLLHLVDGNLLGIKGTTNAGKRFLPKFWGREQVYRGIVEGLKASFRKTVYGTEWKRLEVSEMKHYLISKAKDRKYQASLS